MFVEKESHFPCFSRIPVKTSFPGTRAAFPSSIWDTRRSASSAQRRSIASSTGRLRLVRSFSIRLIRWSAGKDRACSITRLFVVPVVFLLYFSFARIFLEIALVEYEHLAIQHKFVDLLKQKKGMKNGVQTPLEGQRAMTGQWSWFGFRALQTALP